MGPKNGGHMGPRMGVADQAPVVLAQVMRMPNGQVGIVLSQGLENPKAFCMAAIQGFANMALQMEMQEAQPAKPQILVPSMVLPKL